jgi:hypothetical protein
MRRNFKILIIISILFASVLSGFSTLLFITPSSAATPTALTLGATQSFSYTNDSHIATYAINLTKDNLYKITLTNDKGCNIRADLFWPDYLFECEGCGIGIPRQEGMNLVSFNMGVDGCTHWNATSEEFFYFAIHDFDLIINCYSKSTDRNSSVAWEDLGGSITISNASATYIDTISAMNWSLSLGSSKDFKYKKLDITSDGLYQFTLNATTNNTYIAILEPDQMGVTLVSRAFTFSDFNTTDDTFTWQFYLCQGTYYLKATTFTEGCSFDLNIKEVLLPVVSPPTVTSTNIQIYSSNVSYSGVYFSFQAVRVSGLKYRVLYDFSVTSPPGCNVQFQFPFLSSYAFSDKRGENKTESGAMLFIPSEMPLECKYNGVAIPDLNTLMLGAYDEDVGDSVERIYSPGNQITKSCDFIIGANDTIDLTMGIVIFNVSVPFTDTSFTFSIQESSKQPSDLPTTKTYNFSAISDNDDEGIYKLMENTTNTVTGFLMTSMGNNATATLALGTPSGLGIIPEPFLGGSNSILYDNSTYESLDLNKYLTEWAIFEETWVILDDTIHAGYPFQNTTTFTMSYDWKDPIEFDTQYDRNRGEDLTLFKGTLDCCCYIDIEAITGRVKLDSFATSSATVISIDHTCFSTTFPYGTEGVLAYACKNAEYYVVLSSPTSDGYSNIGTFKATVTCLAVAAAAPVIPGYPIVIILSISIVATAIVAFKFYKKRELK